MGKTRREVNSYYHGPVDVGSGNTADYVVAHGTRQRQRGKRPSVTYDGERNPHKALEDAQYDLMTRQLWDDGSTIGYGRVGIKVYNGPVPRFDSESGWLSAHGLVGVKYVQSDDPHIPLRGADYVPNPDGTVAITKPFSPEDIDQMGL